MKEKESDIQNAICDYLAMKKTFFWRQNTAPTIQRHADGGFHFRAMGKYALKGIPDIIVITDGGYAVFLEVKTTKGRQSPEQLEFARRVKEKGGELYVVRSIDDVKNIGL